MGAGQRSPSESNHQSAVNAKASFSLEAQSQLAAALVVSGHYRLSRSPDAERLLKVLCHTSTSHMLGNVHQQSQPGTTDCSSQQPTAEVTCIARLLAALGQAGQLSSLLLDSSGSVIANRLAATGSAPPTEVRA